MDADSPILMRAKLIDERYKHDYMNSRKVTNGVGRRGSLPAKLAAPALANVVQRTRMFRLLDEACRKHGDRPRHFSRGVPMGGEK